MSKSYANDNLFDILIRKFMWDLCEPEPFGRKYHMSLNAKTAFYSVYDTHDTNHILYYYYMYLLTTGVI